MIIWIGRFHDVPYAHSSVLTLRVMKTHGASFTSPSSVFCPSPYSGHYPGCLATMTSADSTQLLHEFPHKTLLSCILSTSSCLFFCLPRFHPGGIRPEDVRIWGTGNPFRCIHQMMGWHLGPQTWWLKEGVGFLSFLVYIWILRNFFTGSKVCSVEKE